MQRIMPSTFLIQFENFLGVGSTEAARVLGIGYSTYAAYRSQSRELPLYHAKHVHALLLHNKTNLAILTDKEPNGYQS